MNKTCGIGQTKWYTYLNQIEAASFIGSTLFILFEHEMDETEPVEIQVSANQVKPASFKLDHSSKLYKSLISHLLRGI